MQRFLGIATLSAMLTLSAGVVIADGDRAMAQAINPCPAKSPSPGAVRVANPCSPQPAANPGAGKTEVDPKLILRPKGTSLAGGNQTQLAKQGKTLFNDTKLSANGMSCAGCHTGNANFAPSFLAPYPHQMAMATEKSGVGQVQLDEAIQFCMIVPMQAKPLPWGSRQLSALTAYMAELRNSVPKQTSETGAANSESTNPCAPKAANPCVPKQ